MAAPMSAVRRAAAAVRLAWLLPCFWQHQGLLLSGAAPVFPDTLDPVVLAPSQPWSLTVGIGQAKFARFTCKSGPADVVISLSTYAQRADPLLFLSLDPHKMPTFAQHDASSFAQWKEDDAGDHYVVAKGVSPDGGVLGLFNMKYFAGEELQAQLSIRCSSIIAFDTLFWDHLTFASVCPVGQTYKNGVYQASTSFCSGHGSCGRNGMCECDGAFTGPACEHEKKDIVVAADGHYTFKVATGRYQYFRVRVPPRFPGGYLSVQVFAGQPLVVLVRDGEIPTKGNFDMSNFDDWLNQRLTPALKFKVSSSEMVAQPVGFHPGVGGVPGLGGAAGAGGAFMPPLGPGPAMPPGRRLLETLRGAGSPNGWPDFFRRAANLSAEAAEDGRRLQFGSDFSPGMVGGQCRKVAPVLNSQACQRQAFLQCRSSCDRCMTCVKGGTDGDDTGCTDACDACMSPGCISNLAYCAADIPCQSEDAQQCDAECGSCMSCFDSNDAKCGKCRCCLDCLPLAAKCSLGDHRGADYNRFVFVGVFNHRRYYNELKGNDDQYVVNADAQIKLVADPAFTGEEHPGDWIAKIYDSFHDLHSVEITQRQIYPAGEQFVFHVDMTRPSGREADVVILNVQLYKDRLTLLRITDIPAEVATLRIHLSSDPGILHILSSSQAAPKTFFDFDKVHQHSHGTVDVPCDSYEQASDGTRRRLTSAWVALFGAQDSNLEMTIQGKNHELEAPRIDFAMVCIFGLVCAVVVLVLAYGGAQKLNDCLGLDSELPIMERLGCLIRQHTQHESTVALTTTRTGSLSGYIGSDVIDRSVEDQYLHRGGTGDDGI